MRVLFVVRNPGFFRRFFDNVVRDLSADGHVVEAVLYGVRKSKPGQASPARSLSAYQAELNGFSWGAALARRDRWRRSLFIARDLINYSSYLQPSRQASRMVLQRFENYLPKSARSMVQYQAVRALLFKDWVQRALRLVERLVPPDRAITRWLHDHQPDIVVASPYIMNGSDEVEYIKAAAALQIPTLVAVMSWDNLTTKGVFQLVPDMTLVWNRFQVEEAIQLHGVPKDKVVITGAPVFDAWFDMRPTTGRASFCRQAGLDPEKPFVLYLCSSWSIAQDETAYVEEVARRLHVHPGLRQVNLLVRPHPWNADIWRQYAGNIVTVWPRDGALPGDPQVRQDFFHAIHFSEAVIGINTSAFIEAAIVDRPCITILAERYRDTQQDISHFHHLLKANFLEVASNIPEAAEILVTMLRGDDAKRDNRRRFVQEFVRPWGIDQPASKITARAIEAAAARCTVDQLNSLLAVQPDTAPAPLVEPRPVVAESAPAGWVPRELV